jgi:hypothetical protein
VASVYVPGCWNTSASAPSRTNAAAWLSRTISFAPFLISFSYRGNRQTIVSRVSSSHSMMSISSPVSLSHKAMRSSSDVVPRGSYRGGG